MGQGEGKAESYAVGKQSEIYDSTAPAGIRTTAAGLMSGLTPSNSRWFALDSEGFEKDEGAKHWLDEAADELWEHIHNANFDAVGFECMIDASIVGLFAMFVDEDPDGGFLFEQWPLAQCYFGCSKAGGPIDSVSREFSMTLEQVVTEYGKESLDDDLRKQWDDAPQNAKNLDAKVEIVWEIQPRTESKRGSRFGYQLPYSSVHVVKKSKHILRENGFHEFPVIAPRWLQVPGSVYATGPMYEALADTKTVNEIVKLDLLNLDVAITGMWKAKDDGVLNPRSIKLGPRKVIVVNDMENMQALTSGATPQLAALEIERLQKSIRRTLLADQLEPLGTPDTDPQKTAYEVSQRINLVREILGPIYGRMQAEYLAPLVTRCFGIAYRAGALGMAPDSMQRNGMPRVKYLSPIARAQKLVDVAAMDRYETTLAQEEKVRPGVADNYDWDAGAQKRSELLGVPQNLIPSKEDIAAVRAQRAKQQQQAVMQEAMAKGGGLNAPIAPNVGLGAGVQ